MGLQMQTETNYMKPDIANWPTIDSKVDGCLKRGLDKFIEDCVFDQKPAVNLQAALEAERVVFAMKESIAKGMPIDINIS